MVNGTNHVTGVKGTRIDFISYHIYGLSGKWLNSEPHIQPQVQRFSQSVLWLKRLMKDFPELKGTEFILTSGECLPIFSERLKTILIWFIVIMKNLHCF